MEHVLKRAFDQVTSSDGLKQKTSEAIMLKAGDTTPVSASAWRYRPVRIKRLFTAACTAFLLCALSAGGYAVYQTPTSYISVDINPSVELGVNTFGKVISVTAFNDDGETVLSGLEILNCNVSTAVKQIISSASENGYINIDGSTFISITSQTKNSTIADKLNERAQEGAEEAIEENGACASVLTNQACLKQREEAIVLGITPGKLNLIEKLIELDPTLSVDDLINASVTEIQELYTELKQEQNQNQEQNEEQNEGECDQANQEQNQEQNENGNAEGNEQASAANGNNEEKGSSSSDSPENCEKPGNQNGHTDNGNKTDDSQAVEADSSSNSGETETNGNSNKKNGTDN